MSQVVIVSHPGGEWPEVYTATLQYERRESQPYRYPAMRIRRQQGELMAKVQRCATLL